MQKKKTADVISSDGTLKIDALTGVVLKCQTQCPPGLSADAKHLRSIVVFDVNEHYRYWGLEPGSVVGFDILDLGYTFVTDRGTLEYEPPGHEWRLDVTSRKPVHQHVEQPV
jgi:hypothetical protein